MTSKSNNTTRNIKKILIHSPNWVGDHVMAFPFYAAIQKVFSNAQIYLVGRSWISSLLPRNTFKKVFILEKKKLSSSAIKEIKALRCDLSFTLSPSFRSAWLLHKTDIPIRVGFKTDHRRLLLKPRSIIKNIMPINVLEHRSRSFLRLLEPFHHKDMTEKLYFQSTKHNWSFTFERYDMHSTNYWVISPGSVAPSKIYPLDKLAILIKSILQLNKKLEIVLIGAKNEMKYAQQIYHSLPKDLNNRIENLIGKTDLSQALYILKNARAVLANDSGIAHLTYLSNTPLVATIGMARYQETVMLTSKKEILNLNLPCSPCMKQVCPRVDKPKECLENISVAALSEAMQKIDPTLKIDLKLK